MKSKEEIEQLAESEYGTEIGSIRGSNPYDLEKDRKNGFIKGYTQCQEDNNDKKYTEDDLHNLLRARRQLYSHTDKNVVRDFINSLNKQE